MGARIYRGHRAPRTNCALRAQGAGGAAARRGPAVLPGRGRPLRAAAHLRGGRREERLAAVFQAAIAPMVYRNPHCGRARVCGGPFTNPL
jgi:hypothetical protein